MHVLWTALFFLILSASGCFSGEYEKDFSARLEQYRKEAAQVKPDRDAKRQQAQVKPDRDAKRQQDGKRPQEAALGHWKFAKNDRSHLYVSKGQKGLDCTWVFSDGEIEEHQMVVKGENMATGVLTLVRWYRADQRSGGKPAGVGTFSDGREMKEEWRFDGDKKAFTVWFLHFSDGMTQRQTMRYVDDARNP